MPKIRNDDKPEHWSDIVGMPDEWDKQNITNLINTFKVTPFTFTKDDGTTYKRTGAQWIKAEVADSKRQNQTEGVGEISNPFGVKSKDSDMRIGTAIPRLLWHEIQEAYPTMFRDTKHYTWFVKNFPEFRVTAKF